MARTVNLLQLRTRARQLSNFENATNLWPDADVTERVNTHLTEAFDLLRAASPPDYYSSSTTITTVSGTIGYALPATFLDVQNVFAVGTASDRLRPMRPMRDGERGFYQAPTGAFSAVLEFTPTPTALSADGDTFDGVNGWDELIVCLVARDMLIKARETTPQLDGRIAELRGRIRSMSNRDRGAPRYLRDVDAPGDWFGWSVNPLACYRLRAANLELYEPVLRYP